MDKKIELIMDAMELEDEITKDTVLEEFEEWDSLSKLALIVSAKKEYGVNLTTDIMKSFVTVGDICKVLIDNK